uniref:Wsv151-like protein n=1 Tax=Pasiphaea japonica whispovirus TaxID=2984286 RepID=A0A9C7EZB8_9VIRU|nr:MAG: wsv151-like protein [Pasiphaea japonica whispovirus]
MDSLPITSSSALKSFMSTSNINNMETNNMVNKTKKVDTEIKVKKEERKKMDTTKPNENLLDGDFYNDIINKYTELANESNKVFENIIGNICTLFKNVRENIAMSDNVTREYVFKSQNQTIYWRGKKVTLGKVTASCVRVGGSYSVFMKLKKANMKYISDDGCKEIVFPDKPRSSLVLNNTYPLIGFEESDEGNTMAVFLTGVDLTSRLPKFVSTSEMNSGFHKLLMKKIRVAKIPVLHMFGEQDTEHLDDYEPIPFIATQSMFEEENEANMEMFFNSSKKMEYMENAPDIEQKVYVYERDTTNQQEYALYSLTNIQTDIVGNSWCNAHASTSKAYGGYSGQINTVNSGEMNDVCCFANCIDVVVDPDCKAMTISVESNEMLFDAKPTPFNKKDAEKYENLTTNSGNNDTLTMSVGKTKKNIPSSFYDYSLEEQKVMESLLVRNETSHTNAKFAERDIFSWWNFSSPSLKIVEEDTALNNDNNNDKSTEVVDQQVTENEIVCKETEAAVKSGFMTSKCKSDNENDFSNTLHEILQNSITKIKKNPEILISFKTTCSKLESYLKELKCASKEHSDIWSTESKRVAEGLLVDEAAASFIAQQLALDICKFDILDSTLNDTATKNFNKCEGQRKHMTGNRSITLSSLKNNREESVDICLKDWIKNKFPNVPSVPSVFTIKMESKSSVSKRKMNKNGSVNNEERLDDGEIHGKYSKGENRTSCFKSDFSTPGTSSSSPPPTISSNGCDDTTTNTLQPKGSGMANILPPSFIKMPRINMGDVYENLADNLGGRLCSMSGNVNIFKSMVMCVNSLEEKILNSSSKRYDTCDDFSKKLLDTPKYFDIESGNDVLSHEVKRLGKILKSYSLHKTETVNISDNENIQDEANRIKFYQRFNTAFQEAAFSWTLNKEMQHNEDALDNESDKLKTVMASNTMKRVYEEHFAFKKVAYLYIFDLLKRKFEGTNHTYNSSLSSSLQWYFAVVARNRICDMFKYIQKPEMIYKDDDKQKNLLLEFITSLCKNPMLISFIINGIISSLKWLVGNTIPSGLLYKGIYEHPEEATLGDCLDETSRFVFSNIPIKQTSVGESVATDDDDTRNGTLRAVRVEKHITGPYKICVDFKDVGITSCEKGSLYVNTITGEGMVTICPTYQTFMVLDEGDNLGKEITSLVRKKSFINVNKHKLLPTFLASPTNPMVKNSYLLTQQQLLNTPPSSLSSSSNVSSCQLGSVFEKKCLQQNQNQQKQQLAAETQSFTQMTMKWDDEKFKKSVNMWRCGFILPANMCNEVLKNKNTITLNAVLPPNPTKMCKSLCEKQLQSGSDFKLLQRMCKAISSFSGFNPWLLGNNINATPPAEFILNVVKKDSIICSGKMSYIDYYLASNTGFPDNYGTVFFNYELKSPSKIITPTTSPPESPIEEDEQSQIKEVTEETGRRERKVGPNVICSALQTSIKNVKSLKKCTSKHLDIIQTYNRKKSALLSF